MIENDIASAAPHYLHAISDSMSVVAAKFRNQPLSFLYESDLQGLLFAELFARLSNLTFSWMSPNTNTRWSRILEGKTFIINPVKTEYPSGRRFDIAVIQPGPVLDALPWDQHVRAAIELKYWQADGTGGGFEPDLKKLEDYANEALKDERRFTGVCAVFCYKADERFISEYFPIGVALNPKELSLKEHGVELWVFTPEASS